MAPFRGGGSGRHHVRTGAGDRNAPLRKLRRARGRRGPPANEQMPSDRSATGDDSRDSGSVPRASLRTPAFVGQGRSQVERGARGGPGGGEGRGGVSPVPAHARPKLATLVRSVKGKSPDRSAARRRSCDARREPKHAARETAAAFFSLDAFEHSQLSQLMATCY
eukprot:COSAG01_NODE_3149_length_6514_cov_6.057210_4_plen_165_part_00